MNGGSSRRTAANSCAGRQSIFQPMSYYDPTRPDRITENKPRKPVLGGMCFFMFAVFLLWFGIMSFAGMLSIS